MSATTSKNPVLVIVGGGFAGITLAKALDSTLDVVLIEKRNRFFYNIGSVRAVTEKGFEKKLFIPYDKLLKKGKVLHADVTEVGKSTVTYVVDGSEPKELAFDYLVIATGSTYKFPAKSDSSAEESIVKFQTLQNRISSAEKILIVGGGPVGVEVAGEIATDYPNKKVTLVHSGDALLAPNLLPKFQKKVFDDLTKLKVEVLLGQRVIAPTPSNGQDSTEKKTDDVEEIKSDNSSETPSDIPELKRQTVTTTKGTSIETDLIFWFTGATVNNNVLQKNFSDLLDESGHVKVNSLLQVEGHENIFAIGDVNNVKEAKMGYFAGAQADLTADNIKKLVKKDKKLKSYIPKGPGMLVSIGRNGGATQFPGTTTVLGGFITKNIKSKHLFIPRYWSIFNEKIPQ